MKKDILSEALEEVLNEAYEETTGLDVPDYEYSDDFLRKMNELTQAPREETSRRKKGIVWKACSALAAAAAIFCVAYGLRNAPKPERNAEKPDIVSEEEPTAQSASEPVVTTAAQEEGVFATGAAPPARETTAAAQSQGTVCTTARATKPAVSEGPAATTNKPSGGGATVTGTVPPPKPPATTAPAVSDLQKQISEYERSIVMKKFLASAAAAATLMNVIPTGAQAAYEPPTVDKYMAEYIFPSLEDGTVSADVNNDGVFDRYDIAALWSYVIRRADYLPEGSRLVSDADLEVVAERGDIDQDYMIRMNDLLYLTRYYLYKNGVDPEDLDIYNYPDTDGKVTLTSFYFVDHLKSLAFSNNYLYKYASDLIKNENVDLDFNSDGTADVYDLFEYQIYAYSSYESPFNDSAAKKLVPLDDATWDKCDEYHKKNFFDNRSDETLVRYYIFNTAFDAEVLNYNNYYDRLDTLVARTGLTAAEKKEMSEALKTLPAAFSANIKEAALEAGLATVTSHSYKLDRQFDEDYQNELVEATADFEAKMLAGKAAPPDANRDGSCNMDDYKTIIDFAADLERGNDATTSINLTPVVWDRLDNDFDLNADGVSGDILDLQIAENIITKYADDASVDLDALLAAFSPEEEDEATKEAVATVNQIRYLEAFSGKAIDRSGDADGNGELKMNDAVLIMQSISNPDKYQLSTWGEFNSDVANTGDGITPKDALGVQRKLLKLS